MEEEEEVDEQPMKVDAVYVRVFASEFFQFVGDDRMQLSRMFGQTFRVNSKTTLRDLYKSACEFWGLTEADFSLFIEDLASPHGCEYVRPDEMNWRIKLIIEKPVGPALEEAEEEKR